MNYTSWYKPSKIVFQIAFKSYSIAVKDNPSTFYWESHYFHVSLLIVVTIPIEADVLHRHGRGEGRREGEERGGRRGEENREREIVKRWWWWGRWW